LKSLLNKSKQGIDYNVCGKNTACDYCNTINYNDTGKCGMKKIRRHGFYNDIAVKLKSIFFSWI